VARAFAFSFAFAFATTVALAPAACRRPQPPPPSQAPPADAGAQGASDPLAGVVDPWSWSRARGATARARALEDIGPYEPADRGAADSPLVNTNGHHWTVLAGLAWDRDFEIDLRDEPVDLDGDGQPDTRVTRHVVAKGGILANPETFGLLPTPDDPRGRIGRVSASTGVLGLREALDADGRSTGHIGMTCWLCHGGDDPGGGGTPILGLPGTRFDYGLLLATSALLDPTNAPAAALRAARGFPPGRQVRARLLLSGPGRQDLTGEWGLDVTVPGLHSRHYVGTARVRQGTRGLVNPVSVPSILWTDGLRLQNWSGSENSEAPYLEALSALVQMPEAAVVEAFGLAPLAAGAATATAMDVGGAAHLRGRPAYDRGIARRTLLLDLRNLGTLGLQQDSFPGLLWADALRGIAPLPASTVRAIPTLYAAREVRQALAESGAQLARPRGDPARVARGRALFMNRVVGVVANRQILKQVPRRHAASGVKPPVLAPIDPDRALNAKLPVRCADCHSAAPTEAVVGLPAALPADFRCDHCHRSPPPVVPAEARRHRAFGTVIYSSGLLLPFDADGDGAAQDDEFDDGRAGGIGTEPLLAFDVPRPDRPDGVFNLDLPVVGIRRDGTPDPEAISRATTGVAWVRVAPLRGVFATAPYLHNGSVPTLRALLEPARKRPVTFSLGRGAGRFVYDTRVSGNRNTGHEMGVTLTPAEKDDLVAFLESL